MAQEKTYSLAWEDYELIDAGGGKKLERWGTVYTIRPEVQAYFHSGKPFDEWKELAHWEFISKSGQSGTWKKLKDSAPEKWIIGYETLKFQLELTKFKHLGLFPEQQTNWEFIEKRIAKNDKFLNLFAYTGASSCAAKCAGADTIHVDSVKQLISWAKVNMETSGLTDIKWVLEDAMKFAAREQKRGNKYKGIVMDPPAWGLGAKGEKWKLEDKIEELMSTAAALLSRDGFLVMNTYSPTLEINTIKSLANRYFKHKSIEVSELWMQTTTGKDLYFGNLLRVS